MLNDTTGAQGSSIGALKLTMEKFYRINGGSTQLKGVSPDINIPDQNEDLEDDDYGERHNKAALPWDEIPPASYTPTYSTGNVAQLSKLSEKRVAANPAFKIIEENSEMIKKKKDDNEVSLNEAEYRKQQEELNGASKKMEEIQKKSVVMDMGNPPADMKTINMDSSSVTKNRDWLRNLSKDIYISETVNIINDMPKATMKVNNMGTGMK